MQTIRIVKAPKGSGPNPTPIVVRKGLVGVVVSAHAKTPPTVAKVRGVLRPLRGSSSYLVWVSELIEALNKLGRESVSAWYREHFPFPHQTPLAFSTRLCEPVAKEAP